MVAVHRPTRIIVPRPSQPHAPMADFSASINSCREYGFLSKAKLLSCKPTLSSSTSG